MKFVMKALCAAALIAPAMTVSASDYAPVTDQRLTNPEPGNWLQYRGNYAGWGLQPAGKGQRGQR